MPNTLDLIAKRGMTFNRYYVSYPLCCPSRVSLLTGRYAHNHNVKGNIQPERAASSASLPRGDDPQPGGLAADSGYRTIHLGKFLNGYGDEPYDNGTIVPPGWNSWHTILKADTNHYFYGYRLNNNGTILRARSGTRAAGTPANTASATTSAAPSPRRTASPATTRPTCSPAWRRAKSPKRRPNSPSTCSSTTPPRTATSAARPGPSRRPATTTGSRARRVPHDRSEGFDEGNVTDKPRFIREAGHLTLNDKHTYRVYWQKQLESLRAIDDGVKLIIDTLGGMGRLRNTYVIFTSDNGFFFGEHRLIGGKFLAYEPATHLPFLIRGAGNQAGHDDR